MHFFFFNAVIISWINYRGSTIRGLQHQNSCMKQLFGADDHIMHARTEQNITVRRHQWADSQQHKVTLCLKIEPIYQTIQSSLYRHAKQTAVDQSKVHFMIFSCISAQRTQPMCWLCHRLCCQEHQGGFRNKCLLVWKLPSNSPWQGGRGQQSLSESYKFSWLLQFLLRSQAPTAAPASTLSPDCRADCSAPPLQNPSAAPPADCSQACLVTRDRQRKHIHELFFCFCFFLQM